MLFRGGATAFAYGFGHVLAFDEAERLSSGSREVVFGEPWHEHTATIRAEDLLDADDAFVGDDGDTRRKDCVSAINFRPRQSVELTCDGLRCSSFKGSKLW